MLGYTGAGPVSLYAGLGGRLGAVRLEGLPDGSASVRSENFTAPLGGPLLALKLALAVSTRASLRLDTELGYAALPARATSSGRVLVALEDLWFRMAIGFGLSL